MGLHLISSMGGDYNGTQTILAGQRLVLGVLPLPKLDISRANLNLDCSYEWGTR